MYGRILKQLRESKGRSQADVARSVGISAAHFARLESSQRGLYLKDFVRIAEALLEKPGNLLLNDFGQIDHLMPLIHNLGAVRPEFRPRMAKIIDEVVRLTKTEKQTVVPHQAAAVKSRRKTPPATRKGRR